MKTVKTYMVRKPKPRAYENFAKDLTKLCKTYGVTIKCIGGVSLIF